jgi:hypothetical protein
VHVNREPQSESLVPNFIFDAVLFAVEEKVPVFAVVDLFSNKRYQLVVKFKLRAHLVPDLVHTVEELNEYWTPFAQVTRAVVTASLCKHVTESKPVFID